ncbi:MAG: PAS-domain containing protein [Magnetospirillum sp.]|nr:PAS-domain containing protein [Magnetospirillum sp.]
MRVWAGVMAATFAPAALAQGLGPVETAVLTWDPSLLLLGVGLMLPLAVWQRWRLVHLGRRAKARDVDARRFAEALAAAPDGFYAFLGEGGESCSRRLAVLLGLAKGTDSSFADVLTAFAPEDGAQLAAAVAALAAEGGGFDLDLSLAEGGRRVRAQGVRACDAGGEALADLVWVRDVTEGAAVVDDLARSLQALATDTTYLKGLIDALPMPLWLRDDDLSLLAVNRAYGRAVDAEGPEAAVDAQVELASEGQVREARALAARARAAGEPRSEAFHLVLSGQRRLTLLTEVPFAVGDKRVTAGFALDHTRIEELEGQLRHHVAAHGEVLERLATAIAIFGTDTRLAFFNTAFQRLWRLDPEWLAGQPTYAGVLDALRERRLLPETADFRATKEEELKRFISLIEPVETLLHLPDGRTLRRLISPHPHGGLIFTYEDVTDSLALERSFNTMMAVQRETLDHLHEGLAVFGGDGRLKLFNPAFCRMWSLAADDLGGGPHVSEVLDRFKPFFAGRPKRASAWGPVRERLLALFADHASAEVRLERQDGAILDVASVPLPDGALMLSWLDVTDSARVERALRERNEALAAADLLKSEFIANVSAEVAKPLTTVIGFSEMLEAEYFGKLNRRQHDYVRGVTEAGQALQSLVADILDLAAIEAGQMTLELDAVDVHPLLADVLSLVRERVREKKLALDFDCPLDIGWIVADRRRLKQVLFGLVGNAVKFTPAGGAITVSAASGDGELAVTVADNGPGFADPAQARLFDSFSHGPEPEAGAGLGLALVKRFVELHGGWVELKSAPGAGTAVTVRLPVGEAG